MGPLRKHKFWAPVIITGRNSADSASLANFSSAADAGDFDTAVLGFVLAVEGDDDAG
jgi:hypothetical protein